MPNLEYQRMLRHPPGQVREALGGSGPDGAALRRAIRKVPDAPLHAALRNLGGHDHRALGDAFGSIDDTRLTVVFASMIKGHRLPSQGHPQNHSALLSGTEMQDLAATLVMDLSSPWARFPAGVPAGALCD